MALMLSRPHSEGGYMPHGICLSWDSATLWAHIVADATIALAYFTIPIALAVFVMRRKDLVHTPLFMLFAAFILACGVTHLLDIWIIWHPDYILQAAAKGFTALISVTTSIVIWPVLRKALAIPGPARMAEVNRALSEEIGEHQATVRHLKTEIIDRRRAEQRFHDLNEQLQSLIDERTLALEQTSRRLEDSERTLRHALKLSNIGVWNWDIAAGAIDFNPPGLAPSDSGKTSRDQTPLDSWMRNIHPDDLEDVRAEAERQLQQPQSFEFEFRLRNPADDAYRWTLARGTVIERDADGRALRALGTHTDIHDRKLVDLQQRKLAMIVENSSDLIGIADSNMMVDYINPAGRRLLQLGATESLDGLPVRVFHSQSAYQRVIEEAMPTALRGERWLGDNTLRRRDGSDVAVSQLVVMLKHPRTGAVEFAVTICRDISERLRLESLVRQHIDELKLQDQRKNEFLAMLAHELRNPLAPITTAAYLLKKAPEDAENLDWCQGVIERQTHQLTRLVNDLLDVSRITSGKITLNKSRIVVADVVERALETCRPNLEERQHTCTVHLPEMPLYVHGDLVRLSQVLSNLLNNAAKFTPNGGHIELDVQQVGRSVRLTVSDNGIGIAPEMLNHIFQLFMQGDQSLQKHNGGLGIGLNLSRYLVLLHGGTLTASSEGLSRGASFEVQLPLALQLDAPCETAVPDSDALSPLRILVVDDNRDAAEGLSQTLRLQGHQVYTAFDGYEAIALAQAQRPGVVFMDIGMPGIDGYDTCRAIRKEPWGRAVVMVAVTGWNQLQDRQRTQAAGFDRHFAKPLEPAQIEALLANLPQRDDPSAAGPGQANQ